MTAHLRNITPSPGNQEHLHDTDAADTKRALADLLPPERCSLDGRVPHNPVRLCCGHVYCRICLQDIAVTAALLGDVPTCKTCYTPFQVGIPTLDEVRQRNGLNTGNGFLFPDDNQYVGMMPNTIGATAQEALLNGGGSSLPWVPPSQRAQVLLNDYTQANGEASLPFGPASDLLPGNATQIVTDPDQPGLFSVDSNTQSQHVALPSPRAIGETFNFGDLFDLERASQLVGDPSMGWNFNDAILPEPRFDNFGNLAFDACADSKQQAVLSPKFLQPEKVSGPEAQYWTELTPTSTLHPPLYPDNAQPKSIRPMSADLTNSNATPAIAPQSPSVMSIRPQRDISILAGQRFCFKGKLLNQEAMEAAVHANGGIVTGGGFKHTTYGIVGSGWKITPSWERNGVRVLDENGFWELLERKTKERQLDRSQIGV